MPPPPSFDYYAELQVEQTASPAEITSAYRRLARIHHPDKNPDNQEEATTIFQRLQLAHETLSDPAKRARYDNPPQSSILNQDDNDYWEVDEDDVFVFRFPFVFFFSSRSSPRRGSSQSKSAYEDAKSANERRARESKLREEARELREKEQRLRREAEEARRKEAEVSKALARRRLQDAEREKQEKRWKDNGTVSNDERLRTCLHSDLCDKVQHTKKFKCTACSARRGMTAFECPCCSALLCQLCLTKSSNRRKKMEMQEQMEASGVPQTQSEKLTVDKSNASKSNTGNTRTKKLKTKKGATASSTKQASNESISGKSGNTNKASVECDSDYCSETDEDKGAHPSGGKFASNNPYDILAGNEEATTPKPEKSGLDASTLASSTAPLSPAHPDGVNSANEEPTSAKAVQSKKRKNKKVANKESEKENVKPADKDKCATDVIAAVKTKTANAASNTQQMTTHPSLRDSSSQNLSTVGMFNKTTKDATVKPENSTSRTGPTRQQDPSGRVRRPTPGTTSGYIRSSNQRATMSMLRQAMEKFGAVRSLRFINKKSGTAHVDFATHDGLYGAMAASPVRVSEQITVRVVELKSCGFCGKTGHVAENCSDANRKSQS
ncbi:hypothetical protein J7T55_013541 [Diaporthe amygdali]|uniref:uncharacterized protein n=1 Tax=Phomopsis amygdali TaxID=1214568 RepID=UPI0022FE57DC|nr:uncharacterized protein J7T55_013541 [Diaporthe amygdali]KAJ0119303.1 hypothetical protein J7T55_013541 [Diaporthe amygdali]